VNWTAIGAIATAMAAVATAIYVVFTYCLLKSMNKQVSHQRRSSEAELMQRLMARYDGLFAHNQRLRAFWDISGTDSPTIFGAAIANPETSPIAAQIRGLNDSRHEVSRFFVSIRKLVGAGYLPKDVLVASLERAAVEWFVERIDPLDRAKAPSKYSAADREYFAGLLARRFQTPQDQ